jgi:hypothetical protein
MFDDRFESVPMAFWETLGQYVYGYMENDQFVYIGKGNGNRALSHTKTKDYNIDNLVIIARNLENFRDDKGDLQSFILESFLIATNDPRDNSVAGHYKECFIMAKFSELFEEFKKDQHDNFEKMPEWFSDNYEVFAGRLNVLTIKSTHHAMEFSTRQQMQPFLDITTEEQASLKVAIWSNAERKAERLEQLTRFCAELGIRKENIVKTGNREIYAIDSEGMTVETALAFINDFFS